MQTLLAVMIIVFLWMQYQARDKGSEIVRRLRKHIVWQTSAMLFAFIMAIFVSHDGYAKTPIGELLAFFVTSFLLVAFSAGTKMFFEIASGKYDDQLK